MTLGAYRDRVRIDQKVITDTDLGRETAWRDGVTYWARVSELSVAGQSRYAQAGFSDVSFEVAFRQDPQITIDDDSIAWGARRLIPISPPRNPDVRGREWVVACRVEVAHTNG